MLLNRSLKLNTSTEECGDVSVTWHVHQTGLSFLEFSSSLEMFLDVVSEILVKKILQFVLCWTAAWRNKVEKVHWALGYCGYEIA